MDAPQESPVVPQLSETSKQVENVPNPTGKGGFQDHPENRSNGKWKAEDSVSYQYHLLIRLTVEELRNWMTEHPENQRTVAQQLAYQATIKASSKLDYLKEVTDRTEGRAKQPIEASGEVNLNVTDMLTKVYGDPTDTSKEE